MTDKFPYTAKKLIVIALGVSPSGHHAVACRAINGRYYDQEATHDQDPEARVYQADIKIRLDNGKVTPADEGQLFRLAMGMIRDKSNEKDLIDILYGEECEALIPKMFSANPVMRHVDFLIMRPSGYTLVTSTELNKRFPPKERR